MHSAGVAQHSGWKPPSEWPMGLKKPEQIEIVVRVLTAWHQANDWFEDREDLYVFLLDRFGSGPDDTHRIDDIMNYLFAAGFVLEAEQEQVVCGRRLKQSETFLKRIERQN